MGMLTGKALLGVMLLSASPAPWSPGIGYTVSQWHREVDAEASPGAAEPEEAPFRLAPVLPPPPSDLARVQNSPAFRGVVAAAVIASQVAMIVAGVASVRRQNARARAAAAGRAPAYRPYR